MKHINYPSITQFQQLVELKDFRKPTKKEYVRYVRKLAEHFQCDPATLAQEQEVLANLIFGEGGRVALEVFGELADIPHGLFFGRLAVIFKLHELLELGDRGFVGFMHRPGRMPLSEGYFPAKLTKTTDASCAPFPLPRSGSVQRTRCTRRRAYDLV